MADARNEAAWNSQVSTSELLSPEPVGLGSEFRTVNRGQTYDATITEFTPAQAVTFAITGKSMDLTGTFRFAETTGGTQVDAEFDLRPKGFMKVIMPLMAPVVRKSFPKELARFKAFCESR